MIFTNQKEKESFQLQLARKSKILYWAETKLKWHPKRDEATGKVANYQILLLGCAEDGLYRYPDDFPVSNPKVNLRGKPIRKFAWRIGRQSGKCLPKDTIIHTIDGKLLPIQEHPLAFPTRQNAVIYNLETVSGYSIRATDNHPISTMHNGQAMWGRMDILQPGDEIECLYEWDKWGKGSVPYSYNILLSAGVGKNGRWEKREDVSGTYEINDELAELLGWITSDGNFRPHHKNSINFRNTNLNYINRVEYLVNKNFPEVKTQITKYEGKKSNKDNYFLCFYSGDGVGKSKNNNALTTFLRAMNNHESGFPRAVAEHFTKSQVCAFFKGLYGGDGNIYIRSGKSNQSESTLACSLNRTYAEYCHSLLLKLGIVNKITVQKGKKATAPFYTVRFRNQTALIKFRDTIGQILDKPIPLGDKFSKRAIFSRYNKNPHFSGPDGEKFVWDKIRKITIEDVTQNCYDVTYPEKGWFIANGVKVHNSECMSVIALYLSICKPIKMSKWERFKDKTTVTDDNNGWSRREINYYRGAKTIVASADATKVKLVFDRVMKLINESPDYSAMLEAGVIEQKLHPYPELKFNAADWTEPAILSFRGPGANGQALRGSTFDYKLYDEVDYIPQSFFEAELATTINAGDAALTILSSTPSGRREQFYYACFEGDTPVLMSDGSFKLIRYIEIGEEVVNRWGKAEKVTDKGSRLYNGWMSHFTTTLDSVIMHATINHKFMAVRESERFCKACSSIVWANRTYCPVYGAHTGYSKLNPSYIEIGKLQLGDFLVIPKNQIKNKKLISFYHEDADFIYVAIDSITKVKTSQTWVYNLTVGEDHSYCVNYYGVANCTNVEWGYEEFHFPSWENPSYNETMDKEFQEKLTTTAYEHEIMADWGTVEEGVFNWNYFKTVFDYEYNQLTSEQKKRQIGFDEFTLLKLDHLTIKQVGLNNLGFWLQKRLPPRKENCKYWFGADLGYSSDPSEFVVFEQFNGIMKLILRLHSANISYDVQCDLIAFMDKHFMFDKLGMDRGNAGIAVEQMLKSELFSGNGYNKYASHNFKDRLEAVNFSDRVSIGNIAGQDQRVPVKQWMTDLIIKTAEERLLVMPNTNYDPDVENQFRNHTYSIGGNGTIIYSKSEVYPEHIVDAVRTCFFAKCTATLPKKRKWPTGASFRGAGRGAWR